MDCKTCKGTGHIEFERGAVVKNCPHCKGTGSVKFITLCDALIGPIIKERNEARAERDELRAQVEAMRALLVDAHWTVHLPTTEHAIIPRCRCRKCVINRIDAALQEDKA